jgi:hypothetical protein
MTASSFVTNDKDTAAGARQRRHWYVSVAGAAIPPGKEKPDRQKGIAKS